MGGAADGSAVPTAKLSVKTKARPKKMGSNWYE